MVRAIKVKSRHRTMKIRTPPALRFILDNGVDPLSELVECASSPELGLGRARASTMLVDQPPEIYESAFEMALPLM